jgi:NADH-quinone oxidoreductase subunit J
VLFVFVIMLIGPGFGDTPTTRGMITRSVAAGLMALLTLAFGTSLALFAPARPLIDACAPGSGAECRQFGGVGGFAHELFAVGVMPFELISMLLTVAIVGAIAVARGRSALEAEQNRRRRLEHEAREQKRATGAELPSGAPAGGE